MTEPSASIWEVTQLILGDPGTNPAEIATAHGYTMAEIAEMLPFVVENLQADFSATSTAEDIGAGRPEPLPGESAEEHAIRWLTGLRDSSTVDLASYDSLDAHADVADWLDTAPGAEETEKAAPGDLTMTEDDLTVPAGFGDGDDTGPTTLGTGMADGPVTEPPILDVDDELFPDPLDVTEPPQPAEIPDATEDGLDIAPGDDPGFE